jgi:hypothetical protein
LVGNNIIVEVVEYLGYLMELADPISVWFLQNGEEVAAMWMFVGIQG